VQCLGRLTTSGDYDDMVDDVVKSMSTTDALFARCELVVQAQQPLTSLNATIELILHNPSTVSQ